MSRAELRRIERRHRDADARFRGEHGMNRIDDDDEPGWAELLLGGALVGIMIIVAVAAISALVDEARKDARQRRA